MSLNITTSTLIFTMAQMFFSITASTFVDKHPDVAFYCNYGGALAGGALLVIKQFFQPKP